VPEPLLHLGDVSFVLQGIGGGGGAQGMDAKRVWENIPRHNALATHMKKPFSHREGYSGIGIEIMV
jgi:hypothetical protein